MITSAETLSEHIKEVPSGASPFPPSTKEKCEEGYAHAYFLYQNKRYQAAGYLFKLLTVADPSEPKYWKGLGAALQMQKDFEGALDSYCCCAQAGGPNGADAALYVQTADCFFALKQNDQAIKALKAAETIAKKSNNQKVLQHVTLMKQVWKWK